MKTGLSRRDFLAMSAKGVGAVVVSYGLMGCSSDDEEIYSGQFLQGIASGDPAKDAVILWTRVTPDVEADITVSWEVALDANFSQIVTNGVMKTNAKRD